MVSRKRALVESEEPPSRRSRFSISLLESELETLKSELEHERSLREIDQKKAQQEKLRLERQVQFAAEESEEAKQLLEETRQKSDAHIEGLRESRLEALRELRECQHQLALAEHNQVEEHDRVLAEEKINQMKKQLKVRGEEIEALKQQLENASERMKELAAKRLKPAETEEKDPFAGAPSSPAPKAILRELNRTRLDLAETERKYRQLRRKSDELQQKAQQYVHQKETARAATARVTKLEHELREARKELEGTRATNQSWADFSKELGQVLKLSTNSIAPEVSTVVRHLQRQVKHTKSVERQIETLQKEAEAKSRKIQQLEREVRDAQTAISREQRDRKSVENSLADARQRVESVLAQEGIWKRETESLRNLLKAYDDILPQTKGQSIKMSQDVAQAAALEEVTVLKKEVDRTQGELRKATEANENLQKEHDRVLDKFGKLRDALMDERAKADKAEDRAVHAEAVAGKGAFNEEASRALHLEKNPLSDAIRERFQAEIRSLRRKLEEATGEKPPEGIQASTSEVDPEKLHQRLKDTFKEQISVFREGVYLITGFKVDMLFDKGGTPYFKVRSVYGEREEDVLVFYWPKGVKQPASLDLGATDFAKTLSTSDSYHYLTKFDSMPGFMASTQLSLLENCTFVQQRK